MPEPSSEAFKSLIRREEGHLQELTRRLYLIEAVQKELDRVTRGKPFKIWSDIAWMLLLDTRDALVIHFGSWAKSVYAKGGFLRQVQAQHIRLFRRRRNSSDVDHEDPYLKDLLAHYHKEAFARLFPTVTTILPRPADIERVKDSFADQFALLVGDRDSNRAHPYERPQSSSARMLDFHELRALVDKAQAFLNDLRLVACDSTFAYMDANYASVEETAAELVDQLLIGGQSRRVVVQEGRERETYYNELHARHDLLESEQRSLFNDYTEDGGHAA